MKAAREDRSADRERARAGRPGLPDRAAPGDGERGEHRDVDEVVAEKVERAAEARLLELQPRELPVAAVEDRVPEKEHASRDLARRIRRGERPRGRQAQREADERHRVGRDRGSRQPPGHGERDPAADEPRQDAVHPSLRRVASIRSSAAARSDARARHFERRLDSGGRIGFRRREHPGPGGDYERTAPGGSRAPAQTGQRRRFRGGPRSRAGGACRARPGSRAGNEATAGSRRSGPTAGRCARAAAPHPPPPHRRERAARSSRRATGSLRPPERSRARERGRSRRGRRPGPFGARATSGKEPSPPTGRGGRRLPRASTSVAARVIPPRAPRG